MLSGELLTRGTARRIAVQRGEAAGVAAAEGLKLRGREHGGGKWPRAGTYRAALSLFALQWESRPVDSARNLL
jgi:hypothetical protein